MDNLKNVLVLLVFILLEAHSDKPATCFERYLITTNSSVSIQYFGQKLDSDLNNNGHTPGYKLDIATINKVTD